VDDNRIKQARILVVDDDESNVLLLKSVLTHAGYENFTGTTDSSEVVELFGRLAPDLILLDFHMPEPDGLAILGQLEAARDGAWFQVLILTSDTSPEIKRNCLAAGAADFLTKPFDQTEVLLRIRNLLKMQFLQLELRGYAHELEKRVFERTRELSGAHVDALERLARAAEYRDYDTGEHTERVGRTAQMIADGLRLPEEEVELIGHAAPLHDIGKIGIPDRILLKPGHLTGEEYEQMKDHAGIGAAILSGSKSRLLRLGEEIAGAHHERWDGSGYPGGLCGDDTPLAGRVVAVADVFDALTHDRPYKTAWPVEMAVEEIVRLGGRKFDPDVVRSFERLDHEQLLAPAPRFERANGAHPASASPLTAR